MAEWWTNRSLPPSSGVMNPKPLSLLNHLTVPVAMDPPRMFGAARRRRLRALRLRAALLGRHRTTVVRMGGQYRKTGWSCQGLVRSLAAMATTAHNTIDR